MQYDQYLSKSKNKCHWQDNSKNRIENPVKEYRESLQRPKEKVEEPLVIKLHEKIREKNRWSVYKGLNSPENK
jgi:hypothetical protein